MNVQINQKYLKKKFYFVKFNPEEKFLLNKKQKMEIYLEMA